MNKTKYFEDAIMPLLDSWVPDKTENVQSIEDRNQKTKLTIKKRL